MHYRQSLLFAAVSNVAYARTHTESTNSEYLPGYVRLNNQ
jgi:hypothetical protein